MATDWLDVSDEDPRIAYTANGTQTSFTVPFIFFDNTDLDVSIDGVLQTLITSYSVGGALNPAGGEIIFTTAPANGAVVLIERDLPIALSTHIPASGPLDGPGINFQFSKIVAMIQQVRGLIGEIISGTFISAFMLTLLDDTTAGEARTTLGIREKLTANRIYYVRTDGNDSNTGLVDSAGGAFLTPQKAWNVINQTLDLGGFTVTIQVRDGTYTSGVFAGTPVHGGDVVFQGNTVTPANVIISTTGTNCFTAFSGARFRVRGMELRTTTSGACNQAFFGGQINFDTVRFGTCAGNHNEAFGDGIIVGDGSYSIVGGAGAHLHAYSLGFINLSSLTATLSGTPAFSNFFAGVAIANINVAGVTFSGSATGQRFLVHKSGQIETNGGGLTFFPGSVAGVIGQEGVYDGLRGDVQGALAINAGSIAAAGELGGFRVLGSTSVMRLIWGVDNTGTMVAYLQSIEGGISVRELQLNPLGGLVRIGAGGLRIDQTPTAVSGAGPIAIGSASTINRRIPIDMNGTTYWIPASTTAF